MYGFISGMSDTDNIRYCPRCGEEIAACCADGRAECEECGFKFYVVEAEESQPEDTP